MNKHLNIQQKFLQKMWFKIKLKRIKKQLRAIIPYWVLFISKFEKWEINNLRNYFISDTFYHVLGYFCVYGPCIQLVFM